MKTWGEIKNEALGLMFSNVNGSTRVALTDADVQEYVINMPDAANYAIRDLSAIVPLLRFYAFTIMGAADLDPVPAAVSGGRHWYLMAKLVTGFRAFGAESRDMIEAGIEAQGAFLTVPTDFTGTVMIPYYEYAPSITPETEDGYVIEMYPECEDLIPIYMASRLYFEDDLAMATMYRNQYESKRAELAERADTGSTGEFTSVTGWW